MPSTENKSSLFRSPYLLVAGIALLILLALLQILYNHDNNMQAAPATAARVYLEGEYRIGDGPWQTITQGEHIPATKGDVTLRGNFHLSLPDGTYLGLYTGSDPVAFYVDHINLTFYEGDELTVVDDHEDLQFGISSCGADWSAHAFSCGTEPVEIVVHNPHRFGNDTAIDEMLANFAIWGDISFERDVMESGETQRHLGLFFVVVAIVLLGSALFSALLHIQGNRIIWLLGFAIFSAGVYLAFSTYSVPFWSEYIAFNTSILGFSMMFYMLFVVGIIAWFMKGTKRICSVTTAVLGVMDGVFFVLPVLTGIRFYDTWLAWMITQSVANLVLLVCLIRETVSAGKMERMVHLCMILQIVAFEADAVATGAGFWSGGLLSNYAFLLVFASALFVVLRIIPVSINATAKAKELEFQRSCLEAELKESRISIMLSQIQPHFIYNTLGTIERMCLKDPQKAFDLVRNFSLYLRGNFSELDSVTLIRFTEELKHIEYYVNIEKVRFPDMNIEYDVETTDFVLPALSVQPLVENAIKHGLMRLEAGGTVVIHSYETPTHFCIEVRDDGVGFDPDAPLDEKKHVGIRNIRGRLKAMVNGELILESKADTGTKALIMIPKEVTV